MKNILILFYLLIINLTLIAQTNITGEIIYKVKFKSEEIGKGILTFNENTSNYIFIRDQEQLNRMKEKNRNLIIVKREPIELDIYNFFNTKILRYLFFKGSKLNPNNDPNFPKDSIVYVEEKTYNFDWKILNRFKKIKGYDCQLAKGEFRGRNWEVWFANTLSLPIGPWKLRDLPGIILEVKDEDKKFTFIASEINLNPVVISPPNFKNEFKEISLKDKTMLLCVYEKKYEEVIEKKILEKAGPTARITQTDDRMQFKGFLVKRGFFRYEIDFSKDEGMEDFHKTCPVYDF